MNNLVALLRCRVDHAYVIRHYGGARAVYVSDPTSLSQVVYAVSGRVSCATRPEVIREDGGLTAVYDCSWAGDPFLLIYRGPSQKMEVTNEVP